MCSANQEPEPGEQMGLSVVLCMVVIVTGPQFCKSKGLRCLLPVSDIRVTRARV